MSEEAPFCGICCLHAVNRGVDYTPGSSQLSDGTQLHDAVTIIAGTAVCWYHVEHGSLGFFVQRAAQGVGSMLCTDGTDSHSWRDTGTGAKECTECGLGMLESSGGESTLARVEVDP